MTVSVKVWGTFAGLSVYDVLGRLLKMRSRALSNTYHHPTTSNFSSVPFCCQRHELPPHAAWMDEDMVLPSITSDGNASQASRHARQVTRVISIDCGTHEDGYRRNHEKLYEMQGEYTGEKPV